jgi:hypothetical protein
LCKGVLHNLRLIEKCQSLWHKFRSPSTALRRATTVNRLDDAAGRGVGSRRRESCRCCRGSGVDGLRQDYLVGVVLPRQSPLSRSLHVSAGQIVNSSGARL